MSNEFIQPGDTIKIGYIHTDGKYSFFDAYVVSVETQYNYKYKSYETIEFIADSIEKVDSLKYQNCIFPGGLRLGKELIDVATAEGYNEKISTGRMSGSFTRAAPIAPIKKRIENKPAMLEVGIRESKYDCNMKIDREIDI